MQKPFGGSGGSNVFAPLRTGDGVLHRGEASERSIPNGIASDGSFGAAIGPLWLQALSAFAGPTHSDTSINSREGAGERRVILNCEVSSISAAALGSSFNVSLGLSNGEMVLFLPPLSFRSFINSDARVPLLQLSAHIVVVAIGVTPAATSCLFKGLAPVFADDGGISVDTRMQSSVECVLAAGDCCTLRQEHSLHWFQMRLWEQASLMGPRQILLFLMTSPDPQASYEFLQALLPPAPC